MTKIPLTEKVPPDYHRLYRFFGKNGFMGVICVDGDSFLWVGEMGGKDVMDENSSDYMDWCAVVICEIRNELSSLNN